MRILLLGGGMQGQAALHDLVSSPEVERITVADLDADGLQAYVAATHPDPRVSCVGLDARDQAALRRLVGAGFDVVIDLLPVPFIGAVARAAVSARVHLVNTFYVTPELAELSQQAAAHGIVLLPEMGMDPGIDLVLLGHAVRSLDRVDEVITYGAGFPAPAAATGPLRYRVTWTFAGVLRSYRRRARVIRDARVVEIPADRIFYPEHIHTLDMPGLGTLEAFPNGDAVAFAERLQLDLGALRNMGRYVLRWPGHAAAWRLLVELGLLDEGSVIVDGTPVDRQRYLTALLEPQLQYRDHEQDIVVVRVDVRGQRDGREVRTVLQLLDRRDLNTGLTAMSRTVGFTASIAAQMVASGVVHGAGLLSPLDDVPYGPFVAELAARGLAVATCDR